MFKTLKMHLYYLFDPKSLLADAALSNVLGLYSPKNSSLVVCCYLYFFGQIHLECPAGWEAHDVALYIDLLRGQLKNIVITIYWRCLSATHSIIWTGRYLKLVRYLLKLFAESQSLRVPRFLRYGSLPIFYWSLSSSKHLFQLLVYQNHNHTTAVLGGEVATPLLKNCLSAANFTLRAPSFQPL